ncbi:MAG: mannose-6-phosphate isomerase [Actinomycetota bacterium]|jgi:mannose-6-phosphate isomerase|nr:mannose-6-phosphate isomerase [Actinomycetota bacterium]
MHSVRSTASRWGEPIVLGPNQPLERPYRGGAGIARLRNTPQPSLFSPEDFVGSTTEIYAGGGIGLTMLADGTTLREAVERDPIAFLGADHVKRYGSSIELLVKLLHTAERLFVHFHPDAEFSRAHLHRDRGKTEAWVIVDTEGDGYAHLGFSRDVSEAEVERWVTGQDVPDMLGAMNRVALAAGDTLFVPARLPHSIGPGITLVELQEPVDVSVLLEFADFGLTQAEALFDLAPGTALSGLDRRGWAAEQLSALVADAPGDDTAVAPLFGRQADGLFRADRYRPRGTVELEAGFSILVVLDGTGTLSYEGGSLALTRGSTVLVPFAVGRSELSGDVEVIRCRPPLAR